MFVLARDTNNNHNNNNNNNNNSNCDDIFRRVLYRVRHGANDQTRSCTLPEITAQCPANENGLIMEKLKKQNRRRVELKKLEHRAGA